MKREVSVTDIEERKADDCARVTLGSMFDGDAVTVAGAEVGDDE